MKLSGADIVLLAISAVLTLVVTITSGLLLYMVKRRGDREVTRDALLGTLGSDVRSLREGMSLGAERAFATLAGRLSVVEDVAEQYGQQLVEVRTQLRVLDRTVEGHVRTPNTYAHPPPGAAPLPV